MNRPSLDELRIDRPPEQKSSTAGRIVLLLMVAAVAVVASALQGGPGSALDNNRHKTGCAFAVTHYRLGKLDTDTGDSLAKSIVGRTALLQYGQLAGSGCRQYAGIVGRGITIHGNPVKRLLDSDSQTLLQRI